MGENNTNNAQSTADYLAQLLKDKKNLAAFPNLFLHIERLLDEEISKVRGNLFQINGMKKEPLILPEAQGQVVAQSEKVYVPVKEHPDFNFVGRILGPRGMTAKQLEQETGCKIMVRGRGSMRDKKKEEQNRGKPNWEHLNDELHVLITVEDAPNRAVVKLARAVEEIKKLLVPAADGEDELKKRQLMELAIINGTYRDSSVKNPALWCSELSRLGFRTVDFQQADQQTSLFQKMFPHGMADSPRLMAPPMSLSSMRSSTPLGAPLILTPRVPMQPGATLLNGSGPPPLIAPGDAGLLYSPYDYHQYAALSPALLAEYPGADHTAAGAVAKQRRHMGLRDHPYQRAGSLS